MTLRLTLAGLLVMALACSGGKDSDSPDGPPPPPPPADDGAGGDDGASSGDKNAEPRDSLTEKANEEADKKAAEDAKIEWETENMATEVKLPPSQRTKLLETGTKLLEAEAKKAGYTEVINVKLKNPKCDGEWCTAAVAGTARKAVKVKAEEGADEGEAVEGGAEAPAEEGSAPAGE